MKRLLFLFALLLQAGGQPINIPVQTPPAQLGSGEVFSQTLNVSPATFQEYKPGYTIPGFYTLSFSVENGFPSYPGYYTAEIDFGTQELGETSGWGSFPLMQVTLVCPSPGYLIVDHQLPNSGPAQGSQPFVIKFSSSKQAGWPLKFSNVSLTFTPESQ